MQDERINFLTDNINVLNKLCLKLDPYRPIPDEQKEILTQFNIHECYDPFKVTNQLLTLLEDYIEELHELKKDELIQ